MKRNVIIPSALGDVVSLAGKSAGGLRLLGAAIPVNHTTEEIVRAVMDTALKANDDYQTAKAERLVAAEAQKASDAKASALIVAARDVLKPVLGSRYSQAWNQAGFLTPSLRVPTTITQRLARVKLLQLYFSAHPEHEVVNLSVTEAYASALYTELDTNINALATAWVTQRQKKAERDEALAGLGGELHKLYRELKVVLPKDDPRWLDFGFGVPADVHVTEAPAGLKLTLTVGRVVASWDDTVNADRFRVYKRVAGIDTAYMPLPTTTDTSFDLGAFASGAHVDVQVTAINSAGESVPSATVALVVP